MARGVGRAPAPVTARWPAPIEGLPETRSLARLPSGWTLTRDEFEERFGRDPAALTRLEAAYGDSSRPVMEEDYVAVDAVLHLFPPACLTGRGAYSER
jgi:hypothetical protein